MLYLDHAATTPIDPEIRLGMMQRFESDFANPSSKHALGRKARQALESARSRIAAVIGAQAAQVLFTGGGTEALGMAVLGSAGDQAARIAISAVEHSAVSEAAYWLRERLGWQVDVLPVDEQGRVKLPELIAAVNAQTRIVAVMLVNNEVGSINDIAAIAAVVRRKCPRAKFVVDAVQAFAKMPVDVDALGADMVAFTSHKIHGPKGIGGLWVKRPTALRPVFLGGGQEAGLRGGTQSVPLAWAFAEAAERQQNTDKTQPGHAERLFSLIQGLVPEVQLVGCPFGSQRAPHILSLHLPGLPSGTLLNALDQAGVCCSAGSACTRSAKQNFSKVLSAMGRRPEEGAFLRFSMGRTTTDLEIEIAAQRFAQCVADLNEVF
jgi:cysteine desulfurase